MEMTTTLCVAPIWKEYFNKGLIYRVLWSNGASDIRHLFVSSLDEAKEIIETIMLADFRQEVDEMLNVYGFESW